MQDLRAALYTHLQRMPLRFFTETKTGEIQSRLANDVGGIQGVVTDTAASITSNVAVSVSTIVAMILIDWRLTLLSLGLLPFFMYLTFRVGKVRREVSSRDAEDPRRHVGRDRGDAQRQRHAPHRRRSASRRPPSSASATSTPGLRSLQIRQAMVGRWFFMIIGTIFSITPAFVYWLAGYLTIQGDPSAPTIGDIVAFTTLQSRLFFPMGQLLNVQVEIQGSLALFDRIFEYLEMDPEIVDAPDAVALDPKTVRGRVRFRDVSFRYPTPPPAATPAAAMPPGHRRGGRRPAAAVAEEVGRGAGGRRPRRGGVGGGDRQPRSGARALDRPTRHERHRADEPWEPARRTRPRRRPTRRVREPFALYDLDFEVEPGQLVALVGPSGSGQDDDDLPHPAALRRRRGRGRDRRPRHPTARRSRHSARRSGS